MIYPLNNKSKLVIFLYVCIGLIAIYFMSEYLVNLLGLNENVKGFVYKFVPPNPPPGPELKEKFNIKLCVLDEQNKCIADTIIDNNSIRYAKITITKKIYESDNNYSIEIHITDIDKLNYIFKKYYYKKFPIFINDKIIASPVIFINKSYTGILSLALWNKDIDVINVVGENIFKEYKTIFNK